MSEGTPDPKTSPPDAASARHRLASLADRLASFRKESRLELEQAVNDFLRTESPQTAEEKKRVAELVNGLLTAFGFAIEYSGQPCSLYVISGAHDPHGRFRIQPRSSSTRRPLVQALHMADLLPLSLTAITSRKSPFDGWSSMVRGNESEGRIR